jgi:ribose transport system substrate-binding protein
MRNRSLKSVGAVLAVVSLVTGTALATASSANAAEDPNVTYAKAQVLKASPAIQAFKAPGAPVPNVKSLAGKTVYYVPAQYAVPLFKAIGDSLTQSLGAAGIKVQVCDAKANPSTTADCFQQAINAKAGAVIVGSLPQEFAATAFKAVTDAGIPILNTLTIPAGPGDPKKVGYLTPNFIGFQATNTDYIIANSGAAANVLYVQATDTPATKIWAEAGALAEYKKHCPKCKVTVVQTSTGQLSKLPSLISSALIKNPNITWIQAEFDSLVQPIVTGLQTSPRRSQIQIVSMDGTLPVLQLVKAKRSVVGDYGYNLNAFGWYAADQALRMMAGQSSLQMVQFPYTRLFQYANTSRLNLTPQAQNTGEWYGSTDYQAGFKKLWGLG